MNFVDWLFGRIVWTIMLGLFAIATPLMFVTAVATRDPDSLALGMLFLSFLLLAILSLLNWSAFRHGKAAKDPMATFVLTFSGVSLTLMCGAFLALTAACAIPLVHGIEDSKLRAAAWVSVLVFAAAAIGLPIRKRFVWLEISPAGLDYSSFGVGTIAWRDIGSVRVSQLFRLQAVALELLDEEKYLGRRSSPIKRWLRWRIEGQAFDVSPYWLAKAIQLRIDRFGGSNSVSLPTVQRQGIPA